MEYYNTINLVKRCGEFLVPDHFASNGGNIASRQCKGGGKEIEGDAIVIGSVGEQVGSEALLLNLSIKQSRSVSRWIIRQTSKSSLPGELLLDFSGVLQQGPDLD
jgi:hypothetical protein